MKILSLSEFLKMFEVEKQNSRTFTEFIANAQVKSTHKITPLKEYMKKNDIHKLDIHILYDHIVNRIEYLTRFYKTSLQPHTFHIMEEPMQKNHLDNNTLVNYKNIIRNVHFKNILQKTKSGFENVPSFLDVLLDLYLKEIIDYKILTPSAIHYIRDGRIGSVFSSFYFRASIMNPYLVFSLNHLVLKGERIFTPTLGWSSYCYGFLECPFVKEYVGVDVISAVCKKTANICDLYDQKRIKTQIYCQPSESLLFDRYFMKKYREHFDVVFFSPPYYELELYPGKKQSTMMYKTYEEWLEGYWLNTIKLCYHVLEKGGTLCYILSSGGGNTQHNILQDMNKITKRFFELKTVLPMYNKNVHVTSENHRETSEKILVFSKTISK